MVMTKTTPAARKLPPAKANTDQRRMTLAECRRLLKDAERKLDAVTTDRNALQGRVSFLAERRAELQQANNAYLARARKAEDDNNAAQAVYDALADRYAELADEREADIILHLEQQTWARMEIVKLTAAVTHWQEESVKWAHMFADYRKAVDEYAAKFNDWVTNLQGYAKLGFTIDVIIITVGVLVWFGLVPPLFPELPWWWK